MSNLVATSATTKYENNNSNNNEACSIVESAMEEAICIKILLIIE